MCTIPLLYLVQAFVAKRLSLRSHEQAEKLQSALKYITTAIQSIETVKCFNGERYELQTFTKVVGVAAGLYKRVANLRSIQIGLMQFFTLSVFVQGFWYGSHLVDTGKSDAGKVLTTFWAALMAISGITMVLPQFIVLQQGKMAGAKLSIVVKQISSSDQMLELQGKTKPARCPGDIEFRKVTSSDQVLRNRSQDRSHSRILLEQTKSPFVTLRYSSPQVKPHLLLARAVQERAH
jgi:ATP-binding cassette subfamily B (MDR/TAP) protein 1